MKLADINRSCKDNYATNNIEVLESASVNIELQNKESITLQILKSKVFDINERYCLTPFSSRQGEYQTHQFYISLTRML